MGRFNISETSSIQIKIPTVALCEQIITASVAQQVQDPAVEAPYKRDQAGADTMGQSSSRSEQIH